MADTWHCNLLVFNEWSLIKGFYRLPAVSYLSWVTVNCAHARPASIHNFTLVLANREWLWGKNDDDARCKALIMLTDFLLNSWQTRERERFNWTRTTVRWGRRRFYKRWTVRNHQPLIRLYSTWKLTFLADVRAVINVKLLSKEKIAILDSKEGKRVRSFITVTLVLSLLK